MQRYRNIAVSGCHSPIHVGFLIFIMALCVSACGPFKSSKSASKVNILNGNPVADNINDVRRTATVALTTDLSAQRDGVDFNPIESGISFCTATIISKRALVTAAHCIGNLPENIEKGENLFTKAEDYIAFFGTRVSKAGKWIRAKRVVVHPDWFIWASKKIFDAGKGNDLGLIILSEDIPEGYEPANIAPSNMRLGGAKAYLAGFGITQMDEFNPGILRETESRVLQSDKDTWRLSLVPWGHGGICMGDSGGPLYVKNGENWYVAGVASVGGQLFGKCSRILTYYVDLRKYSDWIAQELAK